MSDALIVSLYSFIRTLVGIVVRPYETYRRIILKGTSWELLFVGALLSVYFTVNAIVKTPAFRPFVLTRHFVKTSVAVLVTALFVSWLLWIVGKCFGGKGEYKRFLLGWSYTLIPTLC